MPSILKPRKPFSKETIQRKFKEQNYCCANRLDKPAIGLQSDSEKGYSQHICPYNGKPIGIRSQIDHIDGRYNNSYNNCQILCESCHGEKTRRERERRPLENGYVESMYDRYLGYTYMTDMDNTPKKSDKTIMIEISSDICNKMLDE